MYVRPISTRLLRGMFTPAMRAKVLPYPCRCLCRGFWQMTRTRPWRRMILHFSHIGFTDGRTFMVPFEEFGPVTRLWPPSRLPLPRHGAHACEQAAARARNNYSESHFSADVG